jgi:hypothetical protein
MALLQQAEQLFAAEDFAEAARLFLQLAERAATNAEKGKHFLRAAVSLKNAGDDARLEAALGYAIQASIHWPEGKEPVRLVASCYERVLARGIKPIKTALLLSLGLLHNGDDLFAAFPDLVEGVAISKAVAASFDKCLSAAAQERADNVGAADPGLEARHNRAMALMSASLEAFLQDFAQADVLAAAKVGSDSDSTYLSEVIEQLWRVGLANSDMFHHDDAMNLAAAASIVERMANINENPPYRTNLFADLVEIAASTLRDTMIRAERDLRRKKQKKLCAFVCLHRHSLAVAHAWAIMNSRHSDRPDFTARAITLMCEFLEHLETAPKQLPTSEPARRQFQMRLGLVHQRLCGLYRPRVIESHGIYDKILHHATQALRCLAEAEGDDEEDEAKRKIDVSKCHFYLAGYYLDRPSGLDRDNVQKAVEHCTAAAQADLPRLLSSALVAYQAKAHIRRYRWSGLLTDANTAYQCATKALENVSPRGPLLASWCEIQMFLGMAARAKALAAQDQPAKDRLLETSLQHLRQCWAQGLTFMEPNSNPFLDETLMQIGLTYKERTRGSRKENLELALTYLKSVLDRKSGSRNFITMMCALVLGIADRLSGNRADNIATAIRCNTASSALIQSLKKDGKLEGVAELEICQGRVLLIQAADWQKVHGSEGLPADLCANVERSISLLEQVLSGSLIKPETYALLFAEASVALGNGYLLRTKGDRKANIAAALRHAKAVLGMGSRERFPRDLWDRATRLLSAAESEPAAAVA